VLSKQNIEAELSYAYLHAVAAQAGFGCKAGARHDDDAGVDAIVSEDRRRLAKESVLTSFDLHVQLKATYQTPVEQDGKYSFNLTIPRYDKLRNPAVNSARLLVVLYLPADANDWLTHSEEAMIARRCAYWVSLKNAPASINPKNQTVYIPRRQLLSPASLTALMTQLSKREEIHYEG
jgi:hypothetical protein